MTKNVTDETERHGLGSRIVEKPKPETVVMLSEAKHLQTETSDFLDASPFEIRIIV